MGMKTKRLWLKVTDDEYELPVAVADTAVALATMVGVSAGTVAGCVSHTKKGTHQKKSVYILVEFSEQEWEEA